MMANVLLTTKAGMLDKAVRSIRSIKGVKVVKQLLGRYDAIVRVEAGTIGELGDIVLELNSHDAVLSTETLISFRAVGEVDGDFTAIVLVKLMSPSDGERVLEDVSRIENVKAVELLFGFADAIVFISDSDPKKITKIAREINAVEGVFRTETLMVF